MQIKRKKFSQSVDRELSQRKEGNSRLMMLNLMMTQILRRVSCKISGRKSEGLKLHLRIIHQSNQSLRKFLLNQVTVIINRVRNSFNKSLP